MPTAKSMAVPEGAGKIVPSEFGTNTVPQMTENGNRGVAIASQLNQPEHAGMPGFFVFRELSGGVPALACRRAHLAE